MESRNGYSLSIVGGHIDPKGYVGMSNGQNYKVRLTNHHAEKCQATLKIDGLPMGNFLINPYDSITLERPAQVSKKFAFYLSNTREGKIGGIKQGDYFNGLVETTFIPEKPNHRRCTNYDQEDDGYLGVNESMSFCATNSSGKKKSRRQLGYSEGGTVLRDRSSQQYHDVSPLNLDFTREVSLSVRLVGMGKQVPQPEIEPLPGKPQHPSCPCPAEPVYPFSVRIPPPPPVGRKPDPWFCRSTYRYDVYNPYGGDL